MVDRQSARLGSAKTNPGTIHIVSLDAFWRLYPSRDKPIFEKMKLSTPDVKTISARNASETFLLSREEGAANLRLQLQKEIDKLALLIEEVKKQSDKVQAAADAIADRILLEAPRQYSKNRRNGIKGLNGPDMRIAKSVSDGSTPV